MKWKAAVVACAVIFAGCATSANLEKVPRISKEDLRSLVDKGGTVVIDVRSGRDWRRSEYKIRGAVREDSAKTWEWMVKYSKERKMVIYCA